MDNLSRHLDRLFLVNVNLVESERRQGIWVTRQDTPANLFERWKIYFECTQLNRIPIKCSTDCMTDHGASITIESDPNSSSSSGIGRKSNPGPCFVTFRGNVPTLGQGSNQRCNLSVESVAPSAPTVTPTALRSLYRRLNVQGMRASAACTPTHDS
jgi:hypothetical protein